MAGSLFVDGETTRSYASGVYDRTLFDKPLAHYPVWLGIERAQATGLKKVDLGSVPFFGRAPEKEVQIGYFKRGFATEIEAAFLWDLDGSALQMSARS